MIKSEVVVLGLLNNITTYCMPCARKQPVQRFYPTSLYVYYRLVKPDSSFHIVAIFKNSSHFATTS